MFLSKVVKPLFRPLLLSVIFNTHKFTMQLFSYFTYFSVFTGTAEHTLK